MDHTTFALCAFAGFAILTVPVLALLAVLRYLFLGRL